MAPPPAPASAAMIDLMNTARRQNGLAALAADARLAAAAAKHARWMADHRTLSHGETGGGSFVDRIAAEGFRPGSVAENIAEGQATAEAAFAAWMASPGHRANILGRYASVGTGSANDGLGTMYWCADFGTEV